MSSDYLATLLCIKRCKEHAYLAEEHLRRDLQESDREKLNIAFQKIAVYTRVGALAGLGLGVALAFRIRSRKAQVFNAFRASE